MDMFSWLRRREIPVVIVAPMPHDWFMPFIGRAADNVRAKLGLSLNYPTPESRYKSYAEELGQRSALLKKYEDQCEKLKRDIRILKAVGIPIE